MVEMQGNVQSGMEQVQKLSCPLSAASLFSNWHPDCLKEILFESVKLTNMHFLHKLPTCNTDAF